MNSNAHPLEQQMEITVNWKNCVDVIILSHFRQTPMAIWTHSESQRDLKIIWRKIWFTVIECVCYTVGISSLSLPSRAFLGKLMNPFLSLAIVKAKANLFFYSCLAEKVSIAVFNPLTFKLLRETAFELSDIVADVALEQRTEDGVVILAISQKSAGVWIYSFDGDMFKRQQVMRLFYINSSKGFEFFNIYYLGHAVGWNRKSGIYSHE